MKIEFKFELLEGVCVKRNIPMFQSPIAEMVVIERKYFDNPDGIDMHYLCRSWSGEARWHRGYELEKYVPQKKDK